MTRRRTVATAALGVALAVSLLLASGAGPVAAHNNVQYEPGASGHCQQNGTGGAFAFHGPGDHENNFADPAEVQSAAAMAVYFARTGGDCGGSDETYLEVHVISAQNNVQYCYSEESDGDAGDAGHGDEPTDPVTAGAGAGEVTVNDGSRNYPPGDPQNDNDACAFDAHHDE